MGDSWNAGVGAIRKPTVSGGRPGLGGSGKSVYEDGGHEVVRKWVRFAEGGGGCCAGADEASTAHIYSLRTSAAHITIIEWQVEKISLLYMGVG